MKPKILLLAGSLRTGSYNRMLADLAEIALAEAGGDVDHITLKDYPLPIYDGDLEAEEGVPAPAQALHARFRTSHGIMIVSPEYNAGTPPVLKNAIDWISRVRDHGGMAAAFEVPVFALASASPGRFGGYRGLMALRASLVLQLTAMVIPQQTAITFAGDAFNEDGSFQDPKSAAALVRQAGKLVEAARRVEPAAA
jgi:NAD(P)H-dependent FMN reductase